MCFVLCLGDRACVYVQVLYFTKFRRAKPGQTSDKRRPAPLTLQPKANRRTHMVHRHTHGSSSLALNSLTQPPPSTAHAAASSPSFTNMSKKARSTRANHDGTKCNETRTSSSRVKLVVLYNVQHTFQRARKYKLNSLIHILGSKPSECPWLLFGGATKDRKRVRKICVHVILYSIYIRETCGVKCGNSSQNVANAFHVYNVCESRC